MIKHLKSWKQIRKEREEEKLNEQTKADLEVYDDMEKEEFHRKSRSVYRKGGSRRCQSVKSVE